MQDSGNSKSLFEKYLTGNCSATEIEWLFQQFELSGDEEALKHLIKVALHADDEVDPQLQPIVTAFTERVGENLTKEIQKERANQVPTRRLFPWKVSGIAAAVVLALAVGVYIYQVGSIRQLAEVGNLAAADIAPGGNRATLTLADGRTINLSEGHEGIIVDDDKVQYSNGDSIVGSWQSTVGKDDPHAGSLTSHVSHLMSITTPRGGQYQITMPDGTKVWLNAASTLKYPLRFDGEERVVELSGEAYFEVSKSTSSLRQDALGSNTSNTGARVSRVPFIVRTTNQTVEVLGTQFNISAYPDEPETTTTLVEGAVEILNRYAKGLIDADESRQDIDKSNILNKLAPGEQSITREAATDIHKVDVDQYTAWRNGLFSFNGTELRSVMNQLSRWYDVTIEYQGNIMPTHYYGAISRSENLANVLDLLEESGLSFKIEKNE